MLCTWKIFCLGLDIWVPQVMEPHPLTSRPLQNDLQALADVAGIHRLLRLDAGGEHPLRENLHLVLRQQLHHGGRQDDGADGGLGLWLVDLQLAVDGIHLLVDTQSADLEVQVRSLEGQQFTPAHPGGQLQEEQLIHPLRLGLDQKPLDFLPAQNLHLFLPQGRQLTADGRIGSDEALLHRPIQRHLAYCVTAAHRAIRHPRAVALHVVEPPALFHLGKKLLEVGLGQPGILQQSLHVIVGAAGTDRTLRAERIGEYPLGAGALLPLPQQLCRAGRQGDGTPALSCLGLPGGQSAALALVERPAHRQRPLLPVEVGPHQTADLTSSHTGGQLSVEEVVPDRVLFDLLHEPLQLFIVEYLLGGALLFGECDVLCGIPRREPFLYRRVHGLVEYTV